MRFSTCFTSCPSVPLQMLFSFWHCLFFLCPLCSFSFLETALKYFNICESLLCLPYAKNILHIHFLNCHRVLDKFLSKIVYCILFNAFVSPHWHQAPQGQSISYFPLCVHLSSTYYTFNKYFIGCLHIDIEYNCIMSSFICKCVCIYIYINQ